jgi:hypothetical protein
MEVTAGRPVQRTSAGLAHSHSCLDGLHCGFLRDGLGRYEMVVKNEKFRIREHGENTKQFCGLIKRWNEYIVRSHAWIDDQ